MIIVKNVNKFKKHDSVLDTQINIRINSKMLNEFRSITGEKYQTKIRQLIQMYINAYKRKANDK